jgi:hypothetical protein
MLAVRSVFGAGKNFSDAVNLATDEGSVGLIIDAAFAPAATVEISVIRLIVFAERGRKSF